MTVFFTPLGIEYITQLIFTGAITFYLGTLWKRSRRSKNARHLFLLTAFFLLLTIFVFLEFAIVAVPDQHFNALFLQGVILSLASCFAMQFAYSFPAIAPKRGAEIRLVLILSILYVLWELVFAVFRYYQLYQDGNFLARPLVLDYARSIVGIWIFIVLLRQTLTFSSSRESVPVPWRRLWSPQERGAKAVRDLMLVLTLPILVGIMSILHNHFIISDTIYETTLSFEIFVSLFLFVLIYLNALAELVSFTTKVVAITLAISLFVMGAVGWIISPTLTKYYHPSIPSHQTFRFTPQDDSSNYAVNEIPYQFENDLGHKLALSTRNAPSGNVPVDFTFPFYGKAQQSLFVTANGAVTFGAPLSFQNMQYHYGTMSGIVPLYLHLNPDRPDGDVFANRTPDHLIITWDHVSAYYYPNADFTFQLVLYPTGIFDITYGDLPVDLQYAPSDGPDYNPWLSGILCNAPGTCNLSQQMDPYIGKQWPQKVWGNGFVTDYYIDYRQQLSDALIPLVWLIFGGSLFILLGLPFFLRPLLNRPLQSLLNGIRQVDAGKLDISLPVFYQDEVGFITSSFNAMMKQLQQELYNRQALQASPFPLVVIRPSDAKILMANEAASNYFQLSFQELKSAHLTDGYLDPETYRITLKEFKEDGQVTNKILPFKSRTAESRFVQITLMPINWFGESCIILGLIDVTSYRQVEASLRKSAKRLSTLYAASQEISISLDMESICNAIHRAVIKVMACEDFIIDLYDEKENMILPAYIVQHINERVTAVPYIADHGLAGLIVHTGQAIRLNNVEEIKASGIKFELYGDNIITSSVLAVPMWLNGKTVGMLSAQTYSENAYKVEDEELLEMLAVQAAIAIENSRLFERARQEIAERQQAEDQLRQRQSELTVLEDRERIGRELREWLGEIVGYINTEVRPEQSQPANLTNRQWDVLRLVAQGLTYKEVGTELHLTERAVKYHMAQILEQLRLKSRREAVDYARKHHPK